MRGHRLLLDPLCGWGSLAAIAWARPGDAPKTRDQGQATREATLRPAIELHGDRLSARARNAPWAAVLQELERQTGIPIRAVGPLTGTLTHEFEALPLEQGLHRLFRGANLVLFYAPGATQRPAEDRLIRIWLLAKEGSPTAEQPIHHPPQERWRWRIRRCLAPWGRPWSRSPVRRRRSRRVSLQLSRPKRCVSRP
jgi:hypothetical protein